ncbi:MAG: hypothetical protein HZA52_15670 [Planctomycetes bacterium]|nr:hypothetical protein [Planctomycetota bacterium]
MNDKNQNLKRDLAGVALFAAGAFLSVVVGLCYWQGASASDYAGVTIVDKELIRLFGRPACLVLGVVACALGYRMFLLGQSRNLLRSFLIGGVCLAFGTSILMGALNPDYGGVFGQLIGTWASTNLTKFVGLPLGVICVFVPVWFAWLRPSDGAGEQGVGELAPTADRSTEASSGVTAEEAAELIPRRPLPVVKTEAGATTRLATAATRPLDPQHKAPVPTGAKPLDTHDDPPQHAHPSQAPALPQRAAADLPVLGVAVVEDLVDAGIAQEPAGKRSVVVQPADELEEVGPAVPLTVAASHPLAPTPAPTPAPSSAAAARTEPQPPAKAEGAANAVSKPLANSPIAPPSWEQPGDLAIDDIPVDAYGTPMTLVEELRRDSTVRAASAKEDALEEAARDTGIDDEDLDAEIAGEETPRFEVAAQAAVASEDAEVDEDEEEELAEERFELAIEVDEDEDEADDDAEDAEVAPIAAVAAPQAAPALFDDEELEEEASDDEELATPAIAAAVHEDEDEDEEEDDDEADDESVDTAVAAAVDEADDDEAEEDAEGDDAEEKAEEDADEALRREAPLFAAPRAAKAEVAHDEEAADSDDEDGDDELAEEPSSGLDAEEAPAVAAKARDEDELDASDEDDADERHADEDEDEDDARERNEAPAAPAVVAEEREVVLAPRPAPVAPAVRAAAAVEPEAPARELAPELAPEMTEEDELVYKSGVLFLERQRVAVSLLQREFSLDFEQATHVLDRLQAAGLIGPYLGGQRRDILLTLDQWRSRAVAR